MLPPSTIAWPLVVEDSVTVVASDEELVARVAEVVEATGMPVVLRTKLTPPGEQDTTIVVPSG